MRWLIVLLACSSPALLRAREIPCAPVEAGVIEIDGLLGDWKGASAVVVDQAAQVLKGQPQWSGPADLSFELYCNHDDKHLFLALYVHDDYFFRTPLARGDDHVELLFGDKRLVVYPSDLRHTKRRVSGSLRGLAVAEALQTEGYSLELRLPLAELPGYRSGGPGFSGAVWVADCDSKAKQRVETVLGTAPSARAGRFTFDEAQRGLEAFLRERGYRASQVRTQSQVNVVGDKQVEQVVLVGRTLGVLGEAVGGYFYFDLPVAQPKDLYWLKPMDLNGDGRAELVARYLERSGNGRRELVAVYRFDSSDRFVRAFAHEILKGQGERVLINRFSFKPLRRGRRAAGGIDLVFDQPQARGFTRESYREQPAEDCTPILLPWEEVQKQQFGFEGNEFLQR